MSEKCAGAILIVGSLLWDTRQRRATWRKEHLELERRVQVAAHIRYGRKSSNRGSTFTMTLDEEYATGQAVLVPFKKRIGGIEDLVTQAEALWRAEDMNAGPGRLGSGWGCVGVLARPNSCAAADVVKQWSKEFAGRTEPVPPVDHQGLLGIPWPSTIPDGNPADSDLILAVATQTLEDHPTASEIADAWLGQSEGHERYFFENVLHGIRTADDEDIWKRIKHQSPRWINHGTYSAAVELLTKDRYQSR